MAAEGGVQRQETESTSVSVGQGAASELDSLKLLVPAGDGKDAGKMVLAPVKVSRCLHLSIASPADLGKAEKIKETSNAFEEKKLPQQPWHLLNGNFKPAGSRGTTGAASQMDEGQEKKKERSG